MAEGTPKSAVMPSQHQLHQQGSYQHEPYQNASRHLKTDDSSLAYLMALGVLPKISQKLLWQLLHIGDPKTIWQNLLTNKKVKLAGVSSKRREELSERFAQACKTIDPQRLYAHAQALNIEAVIWGSPQYPERLKDCEVPPPVIYITRPASTLASSVKADLATESSPSDGHFGALGANKHVNVAPVGGGQPTAEAPSPVLQLAAKSLLPHVTSVAIIGTRRCSRYGIDIAHELGVRLAASGISVISGLATGIDAAAHRGVLWAQEAARKGIAQKQPNMGSPIAVVAGGVDQVYPRKNTGLFQQVRQYGQILSEWPPGVSPNKWHFPQRNRLVAALADHVIVVESGATGGSFYTVDAALKMGREVFAVPGSIRSNASYGTNKLIQDGANALYDIEAYVEALCAPQFKALAETPKPNSGTQLELFSSQSKVNSKINPKSRDHREGENLAPNAGEHSASPSYRPPVDNSGLQGSWLGEFLGWEPTEISLIQQRSAKSEIAVAIEVERLAALGAITKRGVIIERNAKLGNVKLGNAKLGNAKLGNAKLGNAKLGNAK